MSLNLKADFKSKLQNIWQQKIMFSHTVMQMICAWHKIWTLSGRLYIIIAHAQCSVDEKKIYIFRVHHIRIIAKQKLVHTTWNRECLNNHCQECVRAYLSIHDFFIFSSWGHDRQSSDQNFSSRGYDRQLSEQNNRKLISLHNNGGDDTHANWFEDF